MNDQFIHTECAVRVEMEAMGVHINQTLAILDTLRQTFEARAKIKTPPRKIAAELIWLWATGLATSAETVYNQS